MSSEAHMDDGYKGKHSLGADAAARVAPTWTPARKRVALAAMIAVMGAGLSASAVCSGHGAVSAGGGSVRFARAGSTAASRSLDRSSLDAVGPASPSTATTAEEGRWSLGEDADEMASNLEAAAGRWDAASASRDKLNSKIDEARKQDSSKWTADSWGALQSALDFAVKQAAADPNDSTSGDYDKAASSLQAAMDGLQEKPKLSVGTGSTAAGMGGSLGVTAPVGEMQKWFHDYLLSNGYTEADFSAGVWIINHESGWRVNATNPGSGAYGLPQALPGSKMASEGADWQTNYQTQLKWFVKYCNRYGGIQGSYSAWQKQGWY